MRGAGCTYGDIIDHKIDAKVKRTKSRPIPSGRVSKKYALFFLLAQTVTAAVILCIMAFGYNWNPTLFMFGVLSLIPVAIYPFVKRHFNWPQLFLGVTFSWGALMGWILIFGFPSLSAVMLYAACVLWVIGYDTIYAHQDREDDTLIGVGSTARVFGERSQLAISVFYIGSLFLLFLSFWLSGAGWTTYAGLIAGAIHMTRQIAKLDITNSENCLRLFRSNHGFGWMIFIGLAVGLFV